LISICFLTFPKQPFSISTHQSILLQMRNVFLAALLLLSVTAMAQAGSLDPTFGAGGVVKNDF
jgi:hypothetical protein